jgi:UDP-N-acetylmuramoyl-tripeptide--D-alanyl-D-alanine ligase
VERVSSEYRDLNWRGARVVVDSSESPRGDELIMHLKTIRSEIEHSRMLVVSAGVTISPSDDYDSLGALAAAVIRLRIDQFVGVGTAAKALATQVSLEGSWDGESLWLDSVEDAYDYLRVWPQDGDLIVLSGYPEAIIHELVSRVEADR